MKNLIQMIERHGHRAADAGDGKLRVVCWATKDGAAFEIIGLIDATPKAVRTWLGY